MSSKEKVEMQASQLMTRIKKQVDLTNGITNFENLLIEVNDVNVIRCVITEMHNFLDDFNHIASEVDKLSDRPLISKILTYDFLMPEKFFKNSRKMAALYIKQNRRLVNAYPDKKYKMWDIGHDNKLGNVLDEKVLKYKSENICEVNDDNSDSVNEECRKVILLWNYLPMMVKAIIQTKKRNLGLDNNSKRFGNGEV